MEDPEPATPDATYVGAWSELVRHFCTDHGPYVHVNGLQALDGRITQRWISVDAAELDAAGARALALALLDAADQLA